MVCCVIWLLWLHASRTRFLPHYAMKAAPVPRLRVFAGVMK
jgi:hypothetical protein